MRCSAPGSWFQRRRIKSSRHATNNVFLFRTVGTVRRTMLERIQCGNTNHVTGPRAFSCTRKRIGLQVFSPHGPPDLLFRPYLLTRFIQVLQTSRKAGRAAEHRNPSFHEFLEGFLPKIKEIELEIFTFLEARSPQNYSNRPLNFSESNGNNKKRKREVSKRLYFSPF